MKLVFSIAFLLTNNLLMAQLDPFYYGTYRSSDALERYTIYSMDEIEEDCFIVEYDRLKGLEVVEHWDGYGHCNGEDGRMEILMQKGAKPLPIEFALLASGRRSLTIFPLNENSKVFLDFNE